MFYDTLQTIKIFGGTSMIGGGIWAFTQNVPIYVPIVAVIIGVGLIAFGIFNSIFRYRVWKSYKVIPELEQVLDKALAIHNHIRELSEQVILENRKKHIKTKVRLKLANKYYETLNIPITELAENINPDGTISKKLYKKIKKKQQLKDGEYFTAIPFLKDYAKLLNKSKLGIKRAIDDSCEYRRLSNEYLALQIKLNVPDEIMNDINNLPELSYGLNSMYVGINLPNENRSWINDVPDVVLKQKDDSEIIVTKSYMRATMWLKNKVKKTMFKDAVK
jgi:hypothetical protein